ncbi:MAG: hypothetical protein JWL80_242 [Parcubacteria group bacterium]|nr:hypothetical protein [Parcubacteria group bacterium]
MKHKAPNVFLGIAILLFILTVVGVVEAATPNPGHPWSEVGDGTFQVTGPTVMRTYAYPDANATMVTSSSFAQGDIIYGSAAGTVSQLIKNTTASRYISNSGTSNNPAWAQVDLTNGVTGILTSVNGGTGNGFAKLSGPTTAEKTFTLPDASATILTSNAAVTVGQGGTGLATLTANNVILGNGASTPTFVAPGTNGNVLASNGTTWASGPPDDQVLYSSIGLYPANLTTVTALTTGVTYFQYMGVAGKPYTSCSVLQNVTTLAATITWAEVGVFKGTPVLNGAASLTRLGFTSVAATYNTLGRKSTAVTVAAAAGDQLWVAFGSSATTPFQVRGMLADDLQSGVFQTGTVRPSLAALPFATTLGGAAAVPAWVSMKCT